MWGDKCDKWVKCISWRFVVNLAQRSKSWGLYDERSSQFWMLGVITGEGTSTGGGSRRSWSQCQRITQKSLIYGDVHFVKCSLFWGGGRKKEKGKKAKNLKTVLDSAISALLHYYYLYEMHVLITGKILAIFFNRLGDKVVFSMSDYTIETDLWWKKMTIFCSSIRVTRLVQKPGTQTSSEWAWVNKKDISFSHH